MSLSGTRHLPTFVRQPTDRTAQPRIIRPNSEWLRAEQGMGDIAIGGATLAAEAAA
jgi:hypothetical protein